MNTSPKPLNAEWSHFVEASNFGRSNPPISIAANEEERNDLAKRFSLNQLNKLEAKLKLSLTSTGYIHVTGKLTANLEQNCVVTDDPVISDIESDIEGWFADPEKLASLAKARRNKAIEQGEELPILEENEDPEPLIDGKIDLGELTAQHLSLAIPTYPRRDDAAFSGQTTKPDNEKDPAFQNPFAALKEWRGKE